MPEKRDFYIGGCNKNKKKQKGGVYLMGIKNKVSDNKEIKVTVIISVYNMEDYL